MLIRLDDLLRCGEPDRPAVTYKDETVSYRELSARVKLAAAGLRALGASPGDRVLVYMEKRIETVVAIFAASAAGLVAVPVNPLLKPGQVAYVATDCTARMVITTVERHRLLDESLRAVGSVRHLVLVGEVDAAAKPAGPGTCTSWRRLCEPAEETTATDRPRLIDADIATILYTSGSTGGPKGVVLSHRNLLAGAESVASYLGHTSEDVVLSALPLSFDAGLSQITTAFIAGAHIVLMNYLRPGEIAGQCARHGVTALTCVPPLWMQLTSLDWPEQATRTLRYFANTGGHMPGTTLSRLREIFPQATPYLMYGLTEAFRSTYLDPVEIDRRPDSIGKSIPNAEVLVVRPDGELCAPGEEGEIVHRGALVALGYWNDPARTAERFRPFRPADSASRAEIAVWSGDRAVRDEDGFLFFVGRTDEMIKTSGYRLSPTEIEEAAYVTGLVAEAVALGIPDEALGQHVALVVTAAPDAPEDPVALIAAMRIQLPAYMVPQEVVFLPGLVKSANGKFDRNLLRQEVAG